MKAIEAARTRLGGKPEPRPAPAGAADTRAASASADAPVQTRRASADVPEETRRARPPAPVGSDGAWDAPAAADVPEETRPARPAPPSAALWPGRADALLALAESFMAGAPGRSRSDGERYTVIVHLGPDESGVLGGAGATLEDGTPVTAQTLRRIACDAGLVPVVHGAKGETRDVGRRRRTIPRAVRRALANRDRGCGFPGCTNRQFVDAHHVHHWIDGGRTALDNLVLLCGAHHRLVHEDRFKIRLDADDTKSFATPDGRPLPPAYAPRAAFLAPLPPSGPVPSPNWWGDRIDHELVVSAMLGTQLTSTASGDA
jgi:hypothetical protein